MKKKYCKSLRMAKIRAKYQILFLLNFGESYRWLKRLQWTVFRLRFIAYLFYPEFLEQSEGIYIFPSSFLYKLKDKELERNRQRLDDKKPPYQQQCIRAREWRIERTYMIERDMCVREDKCEQRRLEKKLGWCNEEPIRRSEAFSPKEQGGYD